jgi:uncharacterized protein YndB with AHSA1/START domain
MSDTLQMVQITHVFDAPREAVWEAWTDPDQVARWFGPEGYEVPRESVDIDLRVGGAWRLMMVGGGGEHPAPYEIAELDPPRLLVLKCEPLPEYGIHETTFTRVELHEEGGRTRMELSDGPYTEAKHAEAGWNGAFAKLDALLGGDVA